MRENQWGMGENLKGKELVERGPLKWRQVKKMRNDHGTHLCTTLCRNSTHDKLWLIRVWDHNSLWDELWHKIVDKYVSPTFLLKKWDGMHDGKESVKNKWVVKIKFKKKRLTHMWKLRGSRKKKKDWQAWHSTFFFFLITRIW